MHRKHNTASATNASGIANDRFSAKTSDTLPNQNLANSQQSFSAAESALAEFVQPERLNKIRQVAAARTNSFTVVLDNIHNQHNISAVVRSADAFGLSSLHFVGDSFRVSRGISLGAHRWLDIGSHDTATEAIAELRRSGYKIVITGPEENVGSTKLPTMPVHALPFKEKLALVFGNEKLGVSAEFTEAADICTFIPMYGFVESFNISVAAAICMYASTVAVSSATRQTPLLTESEQAELRSQWLKDDIRGAELILKRRIPEA